METRDWSLVFFTVLTQAAVGAFLVLQVLGRLSHRSRARREDPETGVSLLLVLAVLSAGLFAALFHLSTPLQAARAVVNFSTSWLSREIVFGSLFAVLLGTMAWRERRATSFPLAAWLPRLTAAAGLAFLVSQTAIYLLPAQPTWNSFATPAAFGGTALRLGILGVAAGLVGRPLVAEAGDPAAGPAAASSAIVRGLALAGILAAALEFVVVPLHLAALAGEPSAAAAASVQRVTGDYGGVLLLRLGLLAAAAAALAGVVALARGPLPPSRQRLVAALTSGALGLVLVSEVCGRFLFYAMRVRVGI